MKIGLSRVKKRAQGASFKAKWGRAVKRGARTKLSLLSVPFALHDNTASENEIRSAIAVLIKMSYAEPTREDWSEIARDLSPAPMRLSSCPWSPQEACRGGACRETTRGRWEEVPHRSRDTKSGCPRGQSAMWIHIPAHCRVYQQAGCVALQETNPQNYRGSDGETTVWDGLQQATDHEDQQP